MLAGAAHTVIMLSRRAWFYPVNTERDFWQGHLPKVSFLFGRKREVLTLLQEYLGAAVLIFMAELGDKTELLALTFAVRFSVKQVLGGVFFGSLANHGVAVLIGSYLAQALPVAGLQVAAGFLFLGFALWTLRDAADDEEAKQQGGPRWGPMLTVALAFFVGELGDKTQLTAMTLAASSTAPLLVLAGTVTGMVLTSGLGIWVGSRLGKRVPEEPMKLASAGIFTAFGLMALALRAPAWLLQPLLVVPFLVLFASLLVVYARPVYLRLRAPEPPTTAFRRASDELYRKVQGIRDLVGDLCLGPKVCSICSGVHCGIGAAKSELDEILASGQLPHDGVFSPDTVTADRKGLSRDAMAAALFNVLQALAGEQRVKHSTAWLQQVRQHLELAYFGEVLSFAGDVPAYLESISQYDAPLAVELRAAIDACQGKGA